MDHYADQTIKTSALACILFTVAINISGNEVLKTGLLAAFGAVISFAVTLLLRFVYRRLRK